MTPSSRKYSPTAEVIIVTSLDGCDALRHCTFPIENVRVGQDKWTTRCTKSYQEAIATLAAHWRITRQIDHLYLCTPSDETELLDKVPESWTQVGTTPFSTIISTQEEWNAFWATVDGKAVQDKPEEQAYCGFVIDAQAQLPYRYTAAADDGSEELEDQGVSNEAAGVATPAPGLVPESAILAQLPIIISAAVASVGQQLIEAIRSSGPANAHLSVLGSGTVPDRNSADVRPETNSNIERSGNSAQPDCNVSDRASDSPNARVVPAPGATFASGLLATLEAATARRNTGEATASTLLRLFDHLKRELKDVSEGVLRQETTFPSTAHAGDDAPPSEPLRNTDVRGSNYVRESTSDTPSSAPGEIQDVANHSDSGDRGHVEQLTPSENAADVPEGGWCLCKGYDANYPPWPSVPLTEDTADSTIAHQTTTGNSATTAPAEKDEGDGALIDAFENMLAKSRDAAKAL